MWFFKPIEERVIYLFFFLVCIGMRGGDGEVYSVWLFRAFKILLCNGNLPVWQRLALSEGVLLLGVCAQTSALQTLVSRCLVLPAPTPTSQACLLLSLLGSLLPLFLLFFLFLLFPSLISLLDFPMSSLSAFSPTSEFYPIS